MKSTQPTRHRIALRSDFSSLRPKGFYSFISPVSYYAVRDKNFQCEYFCDGMLASSLFSLVLRRKIRRVSFDYSSIAARFFADCIAHDLRLLVMGGTAAESAAFSLHLQSSYPTLRQQCMDGYPPGGFSPQRLAQIAEHSRGFDAVLLALGSPLQERVGQYLLDQGFPGLIITAGAFVSQTAKSATGLYYPPLINALHLRFLWRLIHEPHTRARFRFVLKFPFTYAVDRLRGAVEVNCV